MKKILFIVMLFTLVSCEKPAETCDVVTDKFEQSIMICNGKLLKDCYDEPFYFFVINKKDTTMVSVLKYRATSIGASINCK